MAEIYLGFEIYNLAMKWLLVLLVLSGCATSSPKYDWDGQYGFVKVAHPKFLKKLTRPIEG